MYRRLKIKWNNLSIELKASMVYMICSLIQKCFNFLTLPLFTRVLTTEEFGQATLYGSWVGVIGILITLNLPYGSFSTAMIKFENCRDGYICAIQNIFYVFTIFALGFYFCFSTLCQNILDLPGYIIIYMFIDIVTAGVYQTWLARQRFEYKYKSVVAVTLFIYGLSLILSLLAIMSPFNRGYLRIIAGAIVPICVGFCLTISHLKKGFLKIRKEHYKFALSFNLPLLIYYFSQIIFNQSDRIMINYYSGTDKAGIYDIAYNISLVMLFVLNAINGSYVPWFYKKLKEKDLDENKKITVKIAILISLLLLIVIWIAPEIVYIVAGPLYMEAIYIIPPIAITVLLLFYSQLFINIQFFYESKISLVLISVISAAANIILNAILIPIYGFLAAGYTTLISYIIFCVGNYIVTYFLCREKKSSGMGYDIKKLLFILFSFVLLSFLSMCLYKHFVIRIACVLLFSFVVLGALFIYGRKRNNK